MADNFDPAAEAAAAYNKARADFDKMARETAVPEAVRQFAEKTVTQSREAYEKAKVAMDDAVGALEKSFDRVGQGSQALNRKVIDIAQQNLNTGFDYAKDLAGARNLSEIFELQAAYARRQFSALAAQAAEIRALATKVTMDAAEPLQTQMGRSVDRFRKND